MTHTSELLWWMCLSIAFVGAVWGQDRYEAYWLAEFNRSSCTTKACKVSGLVRPVRTMNNASSTNSAAVYSADGNNGAMELLRTSPVDQLPLADHVSVSFRWPQGVPSVVLLYVRQTTSARDVKLNHVPGQGKYTRKFFLEDQDVCHLCSSNASVLMDMEVDTTQLSIAPAAVADSAVESTCSVSPVPCPDPTPSSTGSAPTIASTPDVSPSPSLPRTTATPSPDNPGGTIHSPNVSTDMYTTTMISSILVPVIVVAIAIIILAIVGIIICKLTRRRDKVHNDLVHGKPSTSDQEDRDPLITELEDGEQSVMMTQDSDLSVAELEDGNSEM